MPAYQDLETPVVLIVFNRPDTTRQVFERIACAHPKTLFVIADGPRPGKPNEAECCKVVRKIVQTINWECDVHYDFSDDNLGTKMRISSGLENVFTEVDRAIILEDDCLPDLSFFQYCDVLLKIFKDDPRIMQIGGTNPGREDIQIPYSYYFSRYPVCWGWATWARAWKHYDGEMSLWPLVRDQRLFEGMFESQKSVRYWEKRFQMTYEGRLNSWNYPWVLSCWLQNGLSILPSKNLISNIGFGSQATNTFGKRNRLANNPVHQMQIPLTHPPYVQRFMPADLFIERYVYRDSLLTPIKKWLKQRLIKHE
jgi:hypothetical protein